MRTQQHYVEERKSGRKETSRSALNQFQGSGSGRVEGNIKINILEANCRYFIKNRTHIKLLESILLLELIIFNGKIPLKNKFWHCLTEIGQGK